MLAATVVAYVVRRRARSRRAAADGQSDQLGTNYAVLGNEEGHVAKLTLKVAGMTCGHCQKRVETALAAVPGVYGAVVDLTGGFAEVDYDDDAATIEQLTAAVAGAGYSATLDG